MTRGWSRRALPRQSLRADQEQRVARGPIPGDLRLTVVVPAFLEGSQVAHAVTTLRAELDEAIGAGSFEIVVVDDGSPDDTGEQARAAAADSVVVLPVNRGKGGAVRAGALTARGRVVAYTDADLSYSPDQVVALMEHVENGWDLVAGSRRHVDTTTLVRARRLRELSGRIFNLLTSIVLLGQYRDTQCGLKAFRADVAHILFTHQRLDGFAFDVEIFHMAERYRLSLLEMPVVLSSSSRSTVHVVLDAARMVRDLFRVRWWASRGLYDLEPAEAALLDREAKRQDN